MWLLVLPNGMPLGFDQALCLCFTPTIRVLSCCDYLEAIYSGFEEPAG